MTYRSDTRPGGRRIGLVLGCMLACTAGQVCADPAEPSAREAQIKAAFIYNFTKFIEWPPAAFAGDAAPIVIGTFGDSPLNRELATLVTGRTVNGRALTVRRVANAQEVKATHVVFVTAAEDARFAAMLPSIQDGAVLTVGESESFLVHGGGIRLLLTGEKLRFEINVAAAERARLRVSAQLQKLATVVHGRQGT